MPQKHPDPWPLRLAAFGYLAIWLIFVLVVVSCVIALMTQDEWWMRLFVGLVVVNAVLGWLTVMFVLWARCPSCKRRVFVERAGEPKHPAARNIAGLGHFSSIALDVVRNHGFICMHCGTRFDTSKSN